MKLNSKIKQALLVLSFVAGHLFVRFAGASPLTPSTEVFDGQAVICQEPADVGSPGVVIALVGHELRSETQLITFEVTSKVCIEKAGKFKVVDSLPLTSLTNGATLSHHEIVFTSSSAQGVVKFLGSVKLSTESIKSTISIEIPKSYAGTSIDSFERVLLTDKEGPSYTTFGAFRHYLK